MPRPGVSERLAGRAARLSGGPRPSGVVTRRRPRHRNWARLFIALLILPAGLEVSGFHPNDVTAEQLLQPIPRFGADHLLDANYYQDLDEGLASRMAARGLGQWARGTVDYEVFNDSTSPLVFAGSDDWLYWAPHLEVDCDELAELAFPDTPGAVAELRFAIIAPKAAIHPEPYGRQRECETDSRVAWAVRATADDRYIDLNSPLLSTRRGDSDAELFYRRATSWSPTGRLIVAEALVESMAPGLWNARSVRPRPGSPFPENLMLEIGIDSSVTVPGHRIGRVGQLVELGQSRLSSLSDTWVVRVTEMLDNPRVVPGTTIIVGGDQINYVLPYIEQYFERLVFAHWNGLGVGHDLAQYDADRVVVTVSERDATTQLSRPALDWILQAVGAP